MPAHRSRGAFAAAAVLAFSLLSFRPSLAEPLPALGADLMRTTVSGLSSGAYMAGQFQIAYSQIVIGAGLVAGGPYGCADTPGTELNPFWMVVLSWNLSRAQTKCMEDGWLFSTVPSIGELLERARKLDQEGRIDPLPTLAQDKLYLFSSRNDGTVESGVVEAAAEFYRRVGVKPENTDLVIHDRAAHAFVTTTNGLLCGVQGPPYLNACGYDQAGQILNRVIGPLNPAVDPVDGHYQRFEQRPFLAGLHNADFDDEGMVYIPAECRRQGGCTVHIVFHGCKQGVSAVGDAFVTGSGYARWAEANRIIVLFPQVKPGPLNPNGCWDWWGFTGREFLERQAPQMRGVRRMLERLTERVAP